MALAARLRELPTPAVGRVSEGALWLDLRCLRPQEERVLLAQLGGAAP
jgi:L-seryl-tRNA(Ser) seleniumtransferase